MDKKNRALARLIYPLLFAAAGGCSTIDEHVRVAGWPELKVVEHRVPFHVMYSRCKKYTGLMTIPLGCTEFYLDEREAHIWMTPGLAEKTVLAHELLHAQGYDHPGSDNMASVWQRWLAAHPTPDTQAEGGAAAGFFP